MVSSVLQHQFGQATTDTPSPYTNKEGDPQNLFAKANQDINPCHVTQIDTTGKIDHSFKRKSRGNGHNEAGEKRLQGEAKPSNPGGVKSSES